MDFLGCLKDEGKRIQTSGQILQILAFFEHRQEKS